MCESETERSSQFVEDRPFGDVLHEQVRELLTSEASHSRKTLQALLSYRFGGELIALVRDEYEKIEKKRPIHALRALMAMLKIHRHALSVNVSSSATSILVHFFVRHCREAHIATEPTATEFEPPGYILRESFSLLFRCESKVQTILYRELQNCFKQSCCYFAPEESTLEKPEYDPVMFAISALGHYGFPLVFKLLDRGQYNELMFIKALSRMSEKPHYAAGVEPLFDLAARLRVDLHVTEGNQDAIEFCRLFGRNGGDGLMTIVGRLQTIEYQEELTPEALSDCLTALGIARVIPYQPKWGEIQKRILRVSKDKRLSPFVQAYAKLVAQTRKSLAGQDEDEKAISGHFLMAS